MGKLAYFESILRGRCDMRFLRWNHWQISSSQRNQEGPGVTSSGSTIRPLSISTPFRKFIRKPGFSQKTEPRQPVRGGNQAKTPASRLRSLLRRYQPTGQHDFTKPLLQRLVPQWQHFVIGQGAMKAQEIRAVHGQPAPGNPLIANDSAETIPRTRADRYDSLVILRRADVMRAGRLCAATTSYLQIQDR